jgi:hypothetical protein
MHRWPVHLSITRAKLAVIMPISSSSLPHHTAHFSDGTGLVDRSGPPPAQRRANTAHLKTRNQLKGLRVRRTPLSFVACDRKAVILRVQIWSALESDVVGLYGLKVDGACHEGNHSDLLQCHGRRAADDRGADVDTEGVSQSVRRRNPMRLEGNDPACMPL